MKRRIQTNDSTGIHLFHLNTKPLLYQFIFYDTRVDITHADFKKFVHMGECLIKFIY